AVAIIAPRATVTNRRRRGLSFNPTGCRLVAVQDQHMDSAVPKRTQHGRIRYLKHNDRAVTGNPHCRRLPKGWTPENLRRRPIPGINVNSRILLKPRAHYPDAVPVVATRTQGRHYRWR